MKITVGVLVCLLSANVMAADRTATLKALMEAQGLVATFEQQRAAGKEYSQKQADLMLTQVMSGLNAPEKVTTALRAAADTFQMEAQSPLSSEQIVEMWGDFYGKKFSDKELEGLLKFYSSPLAQKEVAASREAMLEFSKKLQADYASTLETATSHFVEAAQTIVKDCNCKK